MSSATLSQLHARQPGLGDVPNLLDISVDDFEADYLQRNRPLLLTEQWQNCDAVNRWTVDYLIDRCGQRKVDVEHYPAGKREQAFVYKTMTLADYLNLVRNDIAARKHYYLAEIPLQSVLPDIAQDIVRPEILADSTDLREVMFVGFDTLTTGHYHRAHTQAVLAQITGQKTVVMFPPADLKYLSMQPWYAMRSNHSRVPFLAGDFEPLIPRWPDLAMTRPLTFTVKPGQLLFIPDHWVHYVYSQQESVSLTWFWDSPTGTGDAPGIRRDRLSEISKQLLMTGARTSNRLKLNKPMVNLAAWLRIISSEDRQPVLDYLTSFGTQRPADRQREVAS